MCEKYYEADKGHGRIEERTYLAVDAKSVIEMKDWPGIKSVIKVLSSREIKDKKTVEHSIYSWLTTLSYQF